MDGSRERLEPEDGCTKKAGHNQDVPFWALKRGVVQGKEYQFWIQADLVWFQPLLWRWQSFLSQSQFRHLKNGGKSFEVFRNRRGANLTPPDMPLWCTDSFKLVFLRNSRHRWPFESWNYPFVRNIYIYKGNLWGCLRHWTRKERIA